MNREELKMKSGLQPLEVRVGARYRVIEKTGFYSNKELNTDVGMKIGDIVEVIEIYPHIVRVKRVNGRPAVECFPRTCLRMILEGI